LNATPSSLNVTNAGFYVNPIRYRGLGAPGGGGNLFSTQNAVSFNTNTSEIFYTDTLVLSTVYTQYGVAVNGTFLTSDSNVKQDISPADLTLCYSNVKQLPLRRFTYIPSYAASKIDQTQIGFIAQEVYSTFPKSIFSTFDESMNSNIMHLNFDQIFLSHYGATQLLISTVENQQTTYADLQAQTGQQESTLQSYNNQFMTLLSSYETLLSKLSTFMS
jgi:hypothetical protein